MSFIFSYTTPGGFYGVNYFIPYFALEEEKYCLFGAARSVVSRRVWLYEIFC